MLDASLHRLKYIERILLASLHSLLLFFFIFLFTRFFIISPAAVNGTSMDPNFVDNEVFFVNKMAYVFSEPKRFDVVQVIDPKTRHLVIKRIIGLPGEDLVMKRSKMYRVDSNTGDHVLIDESAYIKDDVITRLWDIKGAVDYTLGDYEYFILGDNRPFSIDSRIYGPVTRDHIVGRVFN